MSIDSAQLTSIIESAIADGSVPGACLVVVQGDERIEIAQGVADPVGTPLTTQSVGRYYSSVKAVTSGVVMQLVEDGLLTLDAPISSILPEWSVRPAADGVPTVRHLLTHTSGLAYPAHGNGPDVHPVEAAYREAGIDHEGSDSLEEFSNKLAAQPLCFPPGEGWRYGLSHDLLGRVIEVVTGEAVGSVFRERLFARLHMTSSGFVATPEMAARLGACWRHRPGENPELELAQITNEPQMVSCGGGLLSTTDDYVNFLLMLRNGGTFAGDRVLSAASVGEIMSDHLAPELAMDWYDAGFGFGGQVERDGSGRFGWGGYAGTAFTVDRVNDLVVTLHIQVLNDLTIDLWDELLQTIY